MPDPVTSTSEREGFKLEGEHHPDCLAQHALDRVRAALSSGKEEDR